MWENFNSLALFDVKMLLCDGKVMFPARHTCAAATPDVYARKLEFYLLVCGFSFDIMQHLGLCSVFDTGIWKGSVSSQQQCECSVSFPAVRVRATAARPPLCFMLSGAYLHS